MLRPVTRCSVLGSQLIMRSRVLCPCRFPMTVALNCLVFTTTVLQGRRMLLVLSWGLGCLCLKTESVGVTWLQTRLEHRTRQADRLTATILITAIRLMIVLLIRLRSKFKVTRTRENLSTRVIVNLVWNEIPP